MSLFHACTCFEHMCSSSGGQNCHLCKIFYLVYLSLTFNLVLSSHLCYDLRGLLHSDFPTKTLYAFLSCPHVPHALFHTPGFHHANNTRAVRKVSSHYEHLENQSHGLDATWQPVKGDLTAHR